MSKTGQAISRPRFPWRHYAGYALLILLSAALAGALTANRVAAQARAEIEGSLRAKLALLRAQSADWLSDPRTRAAQEELARLDEEIGARLTLMRADGAVVADSREFPSRMDSHANRPEILAARSRGFGRAERYSNTLGTHMIYMAAPVFAEDRLAGFVRASFPVSVVQKRLRGVRNSVILGSGAWALAALLVGFFFARRYSRRLGSMAEVAEAAAEGDYGRRLPAAWNDEIGRLARAINRMAERSRQRMETAEEERGKLLAILSGMVEGVVAVDASERILHMNEAAARILGATDQPGPEARIWEATRVSEVCQAVSAVLDGAPEVKKQVRLARRPVDQVVEVHAGPLPGRGDQPAGAVVVLHDVTELHRLEMVRRDFVANVSHELKTPVTAIRGLVETVMEDGGMAEKTRRRFLSKAHDQTMRLSGIVTDLLTLSRLESGKEAIERQIFNLREPVLSTCRALQPIASERGVELDVEMPEDPPRILGDREAIRQAIGNLIDNALKYTPRGGQVRARLRGADGEAVIEVQDTGIGIDAREQERIFERFYRVDKARSRELGGTGLGLSIVKHIALMHGGRVSLQSAPGKGSTFRMHFPAAVDSPTTRERWRGTGGE